MQAAVAILTPGGRYLTLVNPTRDKIACAQVEVVPKVLGHAWNRYLQSAVNDIRCHHVILDVFELPVGTFLPVLLHPQQRNPPAHGISFRKVLRKYPRKGMLIGPRFGVEDRCIWSSKSFETTVSASVCWD